MYKYLTHFPSTGNHVTIFDIFKTVANDFMNNFRHNFFKHVVLDDKSNMKNMYSVNNENILELGSNMKKYGKIEKPNIYFEFQRRGNNVEDSHLSTNIEAAKRQPGIFGYDLTGTLYTPLYSDPEGIIISFSDLFNRVEFNMTINVATRNDQEDLMSKLDMDINQFTGYTIPDVAVNYDLPDALITLMKDLYFTQEYIEIANNFTISLADKIAKENELNDIISAKLMAYSGNSINLVKTVRTNQIDMNIRRDLDYKYTRHIPVFYKFQKFEMGEGEKKNDIYEKFSITVSGYVEFLNIIGFIIKIPMRVNGNEVDSLRLKSMATDSGGNYKVKEFFKYYVEEREPNIHKPVDWNEFTLFLEEMDMMFDTDKDGRFSIMEWIKDENIDNETKSRYDLFLKIFLNHMDTEKRNKYIYLEIHEDNRCLVPGKDYVFNPDTLEVDIIFPKIGRYYSLKMFINEKKFLFLHKVYYKETTALMNRYN